MSKVSVIIPSRNCSFVSRTIDDIYAKATGDIEVIVLLDGYWPTPQIKCDYKNLTIVHKSEVGGMRHSLNLGANIAKGKYIMKCDDHCIFGESFDEILQKDMEDDWLVNPSRYSIDVPTWTRKWDAIQYLYVTFPYYDDNQYGNGMHGKKWIGEDGIGTSMRYSQYYWKERALAHIPIDDMQTFQGSFWFMTRKKFFDIGMLDEKYSDLMENEPQELGFKVWLSGGRCVVNKNTWYAHMHKSERESDQHGRSWKLSWQRMRDGGRFQTWYWMNNKWPLATRKMEWFVEHFWPIPSWPENWQAEKERYEKSAPNTCSNFRVFDEKGWVGLPLPEGEILP